MISLMLRDWVQQSNACWAVMYCRKPQALASGGHVYVPTLNNSSVLDGEMLTVFIQNTYIHKKS